MRSVSVFGLVHRISSSSLGVGLAAALAGCGAEAGPEDIGVEQSASVISTLFSDPKGQINSVGTVSIDNDNPFFQSIGTNGRTCNSCHKADQGWTISPPQIQALFNQTQGLDPLFNPFDGTNSPSAPIATLAQRRAASSLLLNKGLIRIPITLPATREFDVTVDPGRNPYGVGVVGDVVSVYRRPLPSTNVSALATVMWDGREAVDFAGNPTTAVHDRLMHQANDATRGHAQAARDLTEAEAEAIVAFQENMFTAQQSDSVAGPLDQNGALGGPANLATQPFFIGINDPLGGNPTGAPFTPTIFTLYDAWINLTGTAANNRRASIARGQKIFNTRTIQISGVRGVNDALGVDPLPGNCGTCHSTPDFGNHSVSLPLDLGVTDLSQNGDNALPVFIVTNRATGQVIQTTDPGRALITGLWKHVATFKGPILRGLASRAPYFHNGSAKDLAAVVKFYDTRFHIGFQAQELAALQAFLEAL
jgi:cytochrome c peroxidase